MNSTETAILHALANTKEIQGTEQLTLHIGAREKHHVFTCAMLLYRQGLIDMTISPGGRGNKTIYRDAGVIKVQR